jgi:HTH-type transcriptional regulator / antitoxin PezA
MRRTNKYPVLTPPAEAELTPLKALGKRIREIRKRLDITQEAFAASLGISNTYLSGLELGTRTSPAPEIFFNIASNYRVSLNWLFLGVGSMELEPGTTQETDQRLYVDSIIEPEDLLWFIRHSSLFRDYIMGFAAKFHMDNEDIIKKNIVRIREKSNKEDKSNGNLSDPGEHSQQ